MVNYSAHVQGIDNSITVEVHDRNDRRLVYVAITKVVIQDGSAIGRNRGGFVCLLKFQITRQRFSPIEHLCRLRDTKTRN